jgi:hypothetical protein
VIWLRNGWLKGKVRGKIVDNIRNDSIQDHSRSLSVLETIVGALVNIILESKLNGMFNGLPVEELEGHLATTPSHWLPREEVASSGIRQSIVHLLGDRASIRHVTVLSGKRGRDREEWSPIEALHSDVERVGSYPLALSLKNNSW